MKIAIIGTGNLGMSMALGWEGSGLVAAQDIMCSRRQVASLAELAQKGIQTTSENLAAANWADILIVAVKPYKAEEVLSEIAPATAGKTVVSVMTGIELATMRKILHAEARIFRAMPNTATGIAQSITCISHPKRQTEGLELVQQLFEALGRTVVIEEGLMEAATVLGACGIAYVMRFIRAMVQGGIQIGFDSETASLIATQTVKGAAELLLQGGRHPEEEIDKVTTPKGCTIVGLNEMEHRGFSSALIRGINASFEKIEK
jgi:pyrroline-5-carboxylate reductase